MSGNGKKVLLIAGPKTSGAYEEDYYQVGDVVVFRPNERRYPGRIKRISSTREAFLVKGDGDKKAVWVGRHRLHGKI